MSRMGRLLSGVVIYSCEVKLQSVRLYNKTTRIPYM